jgi:predicted transcriptional regulator
LIGIYIKNNSFDVRWLVRNIEKIETNNDDIQNIDELFDIKYKRLIEKIDNKIEYLKNTKKDLKRIYDTKDFEALIKSFYLILDKI